MLYLFYLEVWSELRFVAVIDGEVLPTLYVIGKDVQARETMKQWKCKQYFTHKMVSKSSKKNICKK